MINICQQCGQYQDDKKILAAPMRAACSNCGHEHEFAALPMFFVTGASGSGKSTVALELAKVTNRFICLDQDILWHDAFNSPDDNYYHFRNLWLRLAKNIHQAGRPVVLFGSTTPDQNERCSERRYLKETHYLTLVCDSKELKSRLKARPHWRGSADNLKAMIEFNQWLAKNAATTEPAMTVIDTTELSVKGAVSAVADWLVKRL